VFISGFFFLILTMAGIRKKLVEEIPKELLSAIAVGIGIFITFIGLKNMGLVIMSEATLVTSGPFSPHTIIAIVVLGIMVLLHAWKVRGSLLYGILAGTLISILMGYVSLPQKLISFQLDISPVFGKLDITGALKWSLAGPIFAMLFVDMFDSIGTILGVAKEANMVSPDGNIAKLDRLLTIDAAATMTGALMGSSTTTTYIESASGISSGGRTGFTSFTTGFLFLLFIPILPLLAVVPSYATGPALVMVGFFMIKNILDIDFKNIETGFPSFLIILLIAFTHGISTGLSFGFISYTLIRIFRGKFRKISLGLWIITLMCVIFLILEK
jgi:AGZA family xanthine/uracil permease-like MFS transporter